MIGTFRWLRWMSILVVGLVLLVGCRDASGGGWIPSAVGNGKATFGFTFHCKDRGDNAELSGQLTYHDQPANVRLHGTMGGTVIATTCAALAADTAAPDGSTFDGAYWPKPNGDGGPFLISVLDRGEPGKLDDEFCIQLIDGLYAGYQNCRPLSSGNIQVRVGN